MTGEVPFQTAGKCSWNGPAVFTKPPSPSDVNSGRIGTHAPFASWKFTGAVYNCTTWAAPCSAYTFDVAVSSDGIGVRSPTAADGETAGADALSGVTETADGCADACTIC